MTTSASKSSSTVARPTKRAKTTTVATAAARTTPPAPVAPRKSSSTVPRAVTRVVKTPTPVPARATSATNKTPRGDDDDDDDDDDDSERGYDSDEQYESDFVEDDFAEHEAAEKTQDAVVELSRVLDAMHGYRSTSSGAAATYADSIIHQLTVLTERAEARKAVKNALSDLMYSINRYNQSAYRETNGPLERLSPAWGSSLRRLVAVLPDAAAEIAKGGK